MSWQQMYVWREATKVNFHKICPSYALAEKEENIYNHNGKVLFNFFFSALRQPPRYAGYRWAMM